MVLTWCKKTCSALFLSNFHSSLRERNCHPLFYGWGGWSLKRPSNLPRAIQPVSDGSKTWIQVCLSLKPQWFSQAPGRVGRWGVGNHSEYPRQICLAFCTCPGRSKIPLPPFFQGQSPKTLMLQVSTPTFYPNKVKPSLFWAGFPSAVLVPPPAPAWVPPECSEAP